MEDEKMQERVNDLEVRMAVQEQQNKVLAKDIHEIKDMMMAMTNSLRALQDWMSGKRAITGFVVGILTVLGGVVAFVMAVIQIIKNFMH